MAINYQTRIDSDHRFRRRWILEAGPYLLGITEMDIYEGCNNNNIALLMSCTLASCTNVLRFFRFVGTENYNRKQIKAGSTEIERFYKWK